MNIFIIARGYPSTLEPIWGCFEKDQAEALARLGHRVTILSVDTRFRRYWRSLGIQHIEDKMLSIFNIFIIPYSFLFFIPSFIKEYFYAWLLELVYIQAVKKRGKPDIIYSHYLHNTNRATHIHQKYNIPLVAIEHSSELGYTNPRKSIINIAKHAYPKVDQLLVVSSFLKENITPHIHIDNIQVVPNIVGDEFTYIERENTAKFRVISIGNFIHRKGFDILIKALSLIPESEIKDLELIILGGGKLENVLKQQIKELNLNKHIKIIGQKSKKEIVNFLQNSDLFVLPSRSETFGVVYIEALACGLPIIATDCGGPRDIVTLDNGLLVPCEDAEALSEAIIHIKNNITAYDHKKITLDCKQRFHHEIIAKRLTTIFEEVIKARKK